MVLANVAQGKVDYVVMVLPCLRLNQPSIISSQVSKSMN
jgi:hypothetical protein